MRTTEQIELLYRQRKKRLDPMRQAALEVRASYYGDVTLPMPEIDRNEKPLVANFVLSSGDQLARRVASTMPDIYYPSLNPGVALRDKEAEQRRLITLAWWDKDHQKLKLRQRARHLVYYASSAVMMRPDDRTNRPTWEIRNPLQTLAPEMAVGDLCPEDIIFVYTKSLAWLDAMYPGNHDKFGLSPDVQDGTIQILEYQDADDCVLLATGERVDPPRVPYGEPIRTPVTIELERVPNRVGRCTAVIGNGIGLEYARGSFDGTIGLWQAMGKLMALQFIGEQRAIWPEEWLVDDPTSDGARIVQHADPLRGITGRVAGGKLEVVRSEPSQMAMQLADRMERFLRIESGSPAELGGESTSNIRTGKRGDQILSAVLDYPIQEWQEIITVALMEEDKLAIAIDKAYFPQTKSFYVSATAGEITYEADKLWTDDTHFVRYARAGLDAEGLVVELGQLVGAGMLSLRSAMEMHPAIEDPEAEFERINMERIREGLRGGLAQLAQNPETAPIVAKVAMKVRETEVEIEDAVMLVQEEMQNEQNQQMQAQQMGGPPGPGGQPGMAQPVPTIAPPNPGAANLATLLAQLHRGQNAAVPSQSQPVPA